MNAAFRKDLDWLDYVNLSISRINSRFFSSSNRWHRDKGIWWCILALDPEILTHDGVYFATTNNRYSGVRRAPGIEGLEVLFAPQSVQWEGRTVVRSASLPRSCPTCEQAEVLYPGEVSTRFLRRIYVATADDASDVHGQLAALDHSPVDVVVDKTKFGGVL